MKRFTWTYSLVVGLVIAVGTAIPVSCATGPDLSDDPTVVTALMDEASAATAYLQAEVTRLKSKALIEPLTPDEAAELARAEALIGLVKKNLDDMNARAAAAGRSPDAGDVVTGLTPLLPPPFNIPAGIIAGALSEWWRGRKKRVSFNRLVGAIDTVKGENPEFAEALDGAGTKLRAAMGPAASELVNRVRNTAP